MALACKICILTKGLKGSEIDSLPKTDDELFDHIEQEHKMVVVRKGETRESAIKRYHSQYPDRRQL